MWAASAGESPGGPDKPSRKEAEGDSTSFKGSVASHHSGPQSPRQGQKGDCTRFPAQLVFAMTVFIPVEGLPGGTTFPLWSIPVCACRGLLCVPAWPA